MSAFAKASMVDLIQRFITRTRPDLLYGLTNKLDPIRSANVPVASKRDVLDLLWREEGPHAVLRIGGEIGNVTYDPLWEAAVRSATPLVFFNKWQRFEVFGHSRNRLQIEPTGKSSARFERYGIDGAIPTDPENLLMCGVMIGILEQIGCDALSCRMRLSDGNVFPLYQAGHFSVPDHSGSLVTARWEINWQALETRPEHADRLRKQPSVNLPSWIDAPPAPEVKTAAAMMAEDAGRHWSVEELARETGQSKRSLQRRLGEVGLSFSSLVRLIRVQEACRLLKDSDMPLTVIGFCAGFSDSAHFSRDFRASVGMTPSNFRSLSQDD